jgi:hypothetical protein
MKELVEIHFPKARKITRVLDNLNTHRLSCLYEAFAPEIARRIAEKLEIVHTPKHGSWLNIAECELSALGTQCLDERIENETVLSRQVTAWSGQRNTRLEKIDWQLTTQDARIKLRHLHPQFREE